MRTYYPEYAEKAKEIAAKVTYSFALVYDMVMMGLTDDEIEGLCRVGASVGMPERDWYANIKPADMYDVAGSYMTLKTEGMLERFQKLFDSFPGQSRKKRKPILDNRDMHNYWRQHS
jgi:(2Fe-2S) ferredoxin